MPLQHFDAPVSATKAVQDMLYDRSSALPEHVRDALKHAVRPGQSGVSGLSDSAEIIYANREGLDPEVLCLGASLAYYGGTYGLFGLGEIEEGHTAGRGFVMADAMLRDAGDEAPAGRSWREPDTDPAPNERFLENPPAPPPPPIPGAA